MEMPTVHAEFLSDEHRLLSSSEDIMDGVDSVLNVPSPFNVAVAANRLCLVLARFGLTDLAEGLLHKEIAFAWERVERDDKEGMLIIAFEAQIALLRLQRILCNENVREDLIRFEAVVDGKLVDFGTWVCDMIRFDEPEEGQLKVRALARDVLVIEACKYYWTMRDETSLLMEAARFRSRWPKTIAAGLHHPSEAPYLVRPELQPVPNLLDITSKSHSQGRLIFVQALHWARGAFSAGRDVRPLLLEMNTLWSHVDGNFLSESTLVRWQAACAELLIASGLAREGEALLSEVIGKASTIGDAHLLTRIGAPLRTEGEGGFRRSEELIGWSLELVRRIENCFEGMASAAIN
jgi:hypothetical protein